jgi:leucyl-tRNA synthetase
MYDHKTIDKKWQDKWKQDQSHKTPDHPSKKKYILDMFPYPSGAGLHVGHPTGYVATDILSRFYRMHGFDILHTMGWDAFGLPAENYAIQQGLHPEVTTDQNTKRFKSQLEMIGLSYDWDREINTSKPDYYKWTQWLFLQFYKNGLAYKKEAYANWCPKDQTVLANEQVVNGACVRCGTQVEQKLLSQWFFQITSYAERLINDINNVDWPEPIKRMQENWIGKSLGARLKFPINESELSVEVFTTRPDTLFGATYLVLAPEHPFVKNLESRISNLEEVRKYLSQARKKSDLQRTSLEKEKSGVEIIGVKGVNPATEQEIPVWIADYVLATYGTGAIMAVPAHDNRDNEFAKKYSLPIKEVIKSPAGFEGEVYTGEGQLVSSGEYSGLSSEEARSHISADFGKPAVQYKLRDWLISRQRYWGAPIPIIYCDVCGMQAVPEDQLPVTLPKDVDFKPTGESPLVYSKEFHNVSCPNCGKPAKRDSDTMDTFVDSSWYFFRYTDPHNEKEFAGKNALERWMPVDHYQGGAEHAVLHLLYARFVTKALLDLGFLPKESFKEQEPFIKLRNQGLVLGPNGEKMSKSKGNVINPDDVIAEYGADTFRMYEMFMGPLEDAKPWSTQGMIGVKRFLDRVVKRHEAGNFGADNPVIHKLVKKITSDISDNKFNTSVSSFMEFLNSNESLSRSNWETYLKLLAPFAPHLTEELWAQLGNAESIHKQSWPAYDEDSIKDSNITLVVQVMGKTRASLNSSAGLDETQAKQLALTDANVQKFVQETDIAKIIYVPDRLINFVLKQSGEKQN